jgi:hypothetical protein
MAGVARAFVTDKVNRRPLVAAVTDFLFWVGHRMRDCAMQSNVRTLSHADLKCKPAITRLMG